MFQHLALPRFVRRPFLLFVAGALPLVWMCVATAASAQPRGTAANVELELAWDGPVGCGAEPVRQWFAQSVTEMSGGPLIGRATVEAREATWHLQLESEYAGERVERSLSGESCDAFQKAAALLLSLRLKPGQGQSVEGTTQPAHGDAGAGPSRGAALTEAGADWAWVGSLLLAGRVSYSPAALGANAEIGVVKEHLEATVFGSFFPPVDAPALPVEGRASIEQWSIGAGGCVRFSVGFAVVLPCARVAAEHLVATSRGIAAPGSDARWFLAGGLGVEGELPVWGALSIRGGLGGVYHREHEFLLEGIAEPVFATGGIEGRVHLGVRAGL